MQKRPNIFTQWNFFLFHRGQYSIVLSFQLWAKRTNLELENRPRIKKEISDEKCTYSLHYRRDNYIKKMEYDESKKCLIIEPIDLITKNGFIFSSENNHFLLFDIPINKSDSNSWTNLFPSLCWPLAVRYQSSVLLLRCIKWARLGNRCRLGSDHAKQP